VAITTTLFYIIHAPFIKHRISRSLNDGKLLHSISAPSQYLYVYLLLE